MGDRWHVEVDRGLCFGSGLCVGSAPEAFQLDSARQSQPRATERDPSETVLGAAESCPAEAILITLSDTGDAVFPPDD